MKEMLTILNSAKNYNDVKTLKKEVNEVNEKSRKYLENSKKLILQKQAEYQKEIKQKDKEIANLVIQIEKQNSTIKLLGDEVEQYKRRLNQIPKFILLLFGKGEKYGKL